MPIGYRSKWNQVLSDPCYSDWRGEREWTENYQAVGNIQPFNSESLHEQERESAGRNRLRKIHRLDAVTAVRSSVGLRLSSAVLAGGAGVLERTTPP